ncbi:MAG: trigger factor [Candidatus Yanofskybacteria bacterium]|nr:trigger factor [Candidatus Yanofskybacteria bacterium]
MTFSTKNLKDSQVELTIDLNKEDLLLYAAETEKRLAKEIKVEGFRPGKAPKEIARKKIGEQVIREEALNLAVQSSLAKVLDEKKLDIMEQSDFKIKENSAGRLIFQIILSVFPEVNLGEFKGLTVKRNPILVNEAEVKNVLEEIVASRAVLKEVKRPARLGDRVEIDFTVKDQGVLIEGGKSENHPVILGENNFIPGFESQIVGLEAGEKKSFALKVPADYYQKSIAGKELDFEVALKRVEEKTVPKLDNDFAKSLGRHESLKELEGSIKQGLMLEKEAKEKERVRLAILKEIADKTGVETPVPLIEKRLDSMIQGLDNELHEKGMELGLYLAHIKKTQDDLRREWRDKAEEQTKMGLVARAVAKKERIKVNSEEINRELELVLQQYMTRGGPDGGPGGPEMLQNLDPQQMKNKIHDVLLNEKVFEFLEKHTKFI